jgi:carboxypeptidase Q
MVRRRVRRSSILHRLPALAVCVACLAARADPPPAPAPGLAAAVAPYAGVARRLIEAARQEPSAWTRLAELTDTFGHRLSGSESLEAALRWAAGEMKKDGLDNVRLEPVTVPRWVRGRESAALVAPVRHELAMLGLGNSVGTPPEGIEAELVIVRDFDELQRLGPAGVKGRIVLFDVPFTTYGETVVYRSTGASRAARLGAIAMLLRSVGPIGLRTPHTGALRYADDAPKIPAASIAVEDAQRLRRLRERGLTLRVRLRMQARFEADALSANLVGEIVGREAPHEIVLVGGHLDSWDVGTGAMDDGGGCVMTWQALRLVRRLGLRPRRTLRVVLFTNEENGLRGALAYRDRHAAELSDHVAALESDSGAFPPLGFGFSGVDAARTVIRDAARLLEPIGATRIGESGGGADVSPLAAAASVPTLSLDVDGARYFIYHHTQADTIERLSAEDLASGSAAVAVMAYVLADLPQRLPRRSAP